MYQHYEIGQRSYKVHSEWCWNNLSRDQKWGTCVIIVWLDYSTFLNSILEMVITLYIINTRLPQHEHVSTCKYIYTRLVLICWLHFTMTSFEKPNPKLWILKLWVIVQCNTFKIHALVPSNCPK